MSLPRREINYAAAIWRRKWLILPFVIVGLLGSIGAFSQMTRFYKAGATIVFIPQTISEEIYDDEDIGQSRLSYMTQTLTSTTFLEEVAAELGQKYASAIALKSLSMPAAVQQLDNETFLLDYVHRSPEEAARRANVLSRLFVERSRADKENEMGTSVAFLVEDIDRLTVELAKATRELAAYQAEHKGELPSDREAHRAEQAYLRNNVADLDLRIEHEQKNREQRLEMLEDPDAARDGTDPLAPPDPRRVQIRQLQAQLVQARLRYTDKHPAVQRLLANISTLLADIRANPTPPDDPLVGLLPEAFLDPNGAPTEEEGDLDALRQYLRLEITRIDETILDLQSRRQKALTRIDEIEERIQASYLRQTELDRIHGMINRLKGQLGRNQNRLTEIERERDVFDRDMDDRYILKAEAIVPLLPFRPDLFQLLAIGLVGSAGLGIGLALLMEWLDRSIWTPEEVEELLQVEVLAAIPNMDRTRRAKARDAAPKRPRKAAGV